MGTGNLALSLDQGATHERKRVVNDFSINIATVNGSGSQNTDSLTIPLSLRAGDANAPGEVDD